MNIHDIKTDQNWGKILLETSKQKIRKRGKIYYIRFGKNCWNFSKNAPDIKITWFTVGLIIPTTHPDAFMN